MMFRKKRIMDLDNLKTLSKVDRDDMLDLLISFPRQCEDAVFIGEHSEIKASRKRNYSHIVFTGVGGSAIGADIVKGFVKDEIGIPISVNRDYTLPQFVNEKTLLFAISYSGDTEETLSAYSDALKRRANIVVITSGGKLGELALKNRDSLIIIPKGYPPRCALGYSFIPAVVALAKLGLVKEKIDQIKRTIQLLTNLQKERLAPLVKGRANISKSIASKIYNKFPIIYASSNMESVAIRWRGEFAENSKTLSSIHLFPEMNHNEIVGWANPKRLLEDFIAIMLKDKGDLARIKKRISITTSILRDEGFRVLEIESLGRSFLDRALSLIYIGDFASFYLSILNRVNPTPVDRITYLKKELTA